MPLIKRVKTNNFRSLAEVDLPLGRLTVLFGPNGSGKSSFLDAILFMRDCVTRGVTFAAGQRSQGIGLLSDAANAGDPLSVEVSTDDVSYKIKLAFSGGMINPFAGESLVRDATGEVLIKRELGESFAMMQHHLPGLMPGPSRMERLRESERLSLGLYLDLNQEDVDSRLIETLMQNLGYYKPRCFNLNRLRFLGSPAGGETRLDDQCENAWSVLRNLHGRQRIDRAYDTILQYMREAFPGFDEIVFEQTGPQSVYASFLEMGRRNPLPASAMSEGHFQLLLLLTVLFSEGEKGTSVILLDEPEISLHPWAIAVLAKAMNEATENWNRQVIIATHSPVLMSQFETGQVFVAEIAAGQTHFTRLDAIAGIGDLLERYSAGTLYMAETVGGQSAAAAVK